MTQTHIHTEADLDAALAALGRADPRFAALIGDGRTAAAAAAAPMALPDSPPSSWRSSFRPRARVRSGDGWPQPSIRSSRRLSCALAPARLARLGLSAPKIRALKEIARAVVRGELALATLGRASPPMQRTPRSPPSTVSARGPPTSISCHASGTPMRGRPATLPCRKRRESPSRCRHGRPPRRCRPWPSRGGRGAPWRRGCCGRITARP